MKKLIRFGFLGLCVILLLFSVSMSVAEEAAAKKKERGKELFYPTKAFSDGKRLYVVDSFNNRVLIYDTVGPIEDVEPSVVVGQPDFESNTPNNGGVSARSLLVPNSAYSDGKSLVVADTGNHRILIYSRVPTANFASADVVLGQPDFTSRAPNCEGISARSLYYPRDVWFDGTRLYVSDTFNNRVLIYTSIPTLNFAPAAVVLGQPDFTTNDENHDGLSARSLNFPTGIYSDGKYLFVADQFNHRVKVYNMIPTANNTPCDVVIGQPDFNSGEINSGRLTPSATSLNNPTSIYYDGTTLYIADFGNNRILVYDSVPTVNNAAADSVLGQSGFESRE